MRVVYATERWGVHDERWLAALRTVGFDAVSVSRLDSDDADFVSRVVTAGWNAPILAGPLPNVTKPLARAGLDVVGLSWGFDIPAMSDLSWLSRLRGLVLDSESSIARVTAAGVGRDRITFLPWGVDLSVFTPSGSFRRPASVPTGVRIVLSLRAHEPLYRIGDIIEALTHLSDDVHLVLGHGGSLTEALLTRAEELGVAGRVHPIGTIPEPQIAALLRAADCYVSATEVDGTSVTLLQAMACGTPVAVSAIEGNLAWVDEGRTGRLFHLGDPQSAASAIRRALDDPSTTQAALDLVTRDADWNRNIERLRHALEER